MRRTTAWPLVLGVLVTGGCTGEPAPHETPVVEATVRVVVPGEEPVRDATRPTERAVRVDPAPDLSGYVDPAPDLSARVDQAPPAAGASFLLAGLLEGDERFGAVRPEPDGSMVLVWHGEPPHEALATVAAAHPDVPVRVQALPVAPGDLPGLAQSLLADGRRPEVTGAYVRDDLSSIVVQVPVGTVANPLTLAARLTAEVGFPVVVEAVA